VGTADELYSFANLWRQYRICRRNKRNTSNALRFEIDAEAKLLLLQQELREHSYRPGRSVCFVTDGVKPREVFAADFRDRVVHHVLVSRQEEVFESRFIHDSYACRKGRGVLAASDRLMQFLRSATANGRRPAWALKLDVAGFFPTIDKQRLDAIISRHIRDPEVLWLTRVLLFHDPTTDYRFRSKERAIACPAHPDYPIPARKSLFGKGNQCGLPIGNLTSQFWGNVYLNEIDQFVKRELRCRHYVRYVDDMILLSTSRDQLAEWRAQIGEFLDTRLKLRLRPDTRDPFPVSLGVDFVGWKTFWNYRLPRRQTLRSGARRLQQFERQHVMGMWNGAAQRIDIERSRSGVNELVASMASYSGHLRHGASWREWRRMLDRRPWTAGLLLQRPEQGWQTGERWPAGILDSKRFSRQYGRFIRSADERTLIFCQVGRFIEFFGPQRELAARVLRLAQVRMGRGGYAFSVGFPVALRHEFVSRAIRSGVAVADVREAGLSASGCAARVVVALWLPR